MNLGILPQAPAQTPKPVQPKTVYWVLGAAVAVLAAGVLFYVLKRKK